MFTQEIFSAQPNSTMVYIQNQILKRILVTETPKISPIEGIGLVGGYMGLFIGASVISLIEFVKFLFDVIILKCCNLKDKNDDFHPEGIHKQV